MCRLYRLDDGRHLVDTGGTAQHRQPTAESRISVVTLLVTDVAVILGLFFYWLPLVIEFCVTATLILQASLVCTFKFRLLL